MTLFDLLQGERGIITKINGHGSFRKRITEMGFIIGKEIEVIKKAPLRDPIEYKILDYFVSLRNSEAKLIEVISEKEAIRNFNKDFNGIIDSKILKQAYNKKGKTINIAFVGNPNCGKTTIFNQASGSSERVGNYSGVTVDAKKSHFKLDGYRFNVVDLPGTYSVTAYSPEELYVRNYIIDQHPDIVINVLDASNLERNLYLTTQLIDMDIKVVIALNMYDELEKNGDSLNYRQLGKMLGIPFIPTVGSKGIGIKNLFRKVIDVYEDREEIVRHIHVNYGKNIESSIQNIQNKIKQPANHVVTNNISPRFLSIKLIEKDADAQERIKLCQNVTNIKKSVSKEIEKLEKSLLDNSETLIADAKYAFISGALKETMLSNSEKHVKKSQIIDILITNKFWGIPIFAFFMWLTFFTTFKLGQYPMNWIELGVNYLSQVLQANVAEGVLKDLLIDGIIGGVGGVLVFLPNIVILYFFISIMEDTGYMARAVFIMDRLMHKIGLHGKSFIPMLMGFGCNVPAIMATRTIESKRDRLLTMLIIPFMSCSAKLPVYILFITAFFTSNQATILFGMYAIGILIAIISSLFLSKTLFKKTDVPFVMELPPYRTPSFKSLLIHMWNSAEQYLKKIAGTILIASIIIWALGYFPHDIQLSRDFDQEISHLESNRSALANTSNTQAFAIDKINKKITELNKRKNSELQEKSYIGQLGKAIQPVMAPMDFDWKMSVGIIAGIAAKEVVVGTLGVLYQAEEEGVSSSNLGDKLQSQKYINGERKGERIIYPLNALAYMLFILIYFPCIGTITAIGKESGSWKWAVFEIFFTTIIAWSVSFAFYQIGSFFI